jgi:ribosomal protein S18 acetylase RimI-like enzyme
MDVRNETGSRCCRFLSEGDFQALYQAFSAAFSDYVMPFALTETQLKNHLRLTAVALDRTMGCFAGDWMMGFSLNGFGEWNGRSTVYDAGTGVIPAARRQGIAREMFSAMLPVFKREGIEQFLLEVIHNNIGALRLYEQLGFEITRELSLLQCDKWTEPDHPVPSGLGIHDIERPDWRLLTSFWDGTPSWQNSPTAIDRSIANKRILGAILDGQCVGYIVFSGKFGRVAQMAVAREHRGIGIGTSLVSAMQKHTGPGYSMQVINIDRSLSDAMRLYKRLGFYERLVQYEMVLPLS